MYIAEFEITDLRSFSSKQAVSLEREGKDTYAGWTVFCGSQRFRQERAPSARRSPHRPWPLAARSLAGTFPAWVRKGANRARVATRLTVDPNHDKFQNRWADRGDAVLDCTSMEGQQRGTQRSRAIDGQREEGIPQGWDRGPLDRHTRGLVHRGLRALSPPGTGRGGNGADDADPVLARLINLFNEGATLSEAVDWLKQIHLRALEGREGAAELRDDVIALLNDGLLPDGSEVDHVDSDELWICRDGVTLPLEQVSDGYRTVAAVVIDIARRIHATFAGLHLRRAPSGHQSCPLPEWCSSTRSTRTCTSLGSRRSASGSPVASRQSSSS